MSTRRACFHDLRIPVRGYPFVRKRGLFGYDAKMTDEERKFAVPSGEFETVIPKMPENQDWAVICEFIKSLLVDKTTPDVFGSVVNICHNQIYKMTLRDYPVHNLFDYDSIRCLAFDFVLSMVINEREGPKKDCFHPVHGMMWVLWSKMSRLTDPLNEEVCGVDFIFSRCEKRNINEVTKPYGKDFLYELGRNLYIPYLE